MPRPAIKLLRSRPRPVSCYGVTEDHRLKAHLCRIRQRAVSRFMETKCSSPSARRCLLPSTRRQEKKSGLPRLKKTRTATTPRWHRSPPTEKFSWVHPVESLAFVASLLRSMPIQARNCGGPSRCPRRESQAAKPGRKAINGRMAAARFG